MHVNMHMCICVQGYIMAIFMFSGNESVYVTNSTELGKYVIKVGK